LSFVAFLTGGSEKLPPFPAVPVSTEVYLKQGLVRLVKMKTAHFSKFAVKHLQIAHRFALTATVSLICLPTTALPVLAQSPADRFVGTLEVIQLAMFVGSMSAALLAATWMIRLRTKLSVENTELRARLSAQSANLERFETLGELSGQMALVWVGGDEKPELIGVLGAETGAPDNRATVLAFARWLSPDGAMKMQRAIDGLRQSGHAFSILTETQNGTMLEVIGKTSGNRAIVRFLALTAYQAEAAAQEAATASMREERDQLRRLLHEMEEPAWIRGEDGKLIWVNQAYAAAVGQADAAATLASQAELLGSVTRRQIAETQLTGQAYRETVSTVVGHDRRRYAVIDVRQPSGGALGVALDVSDIEQLQAEVKRMTKNHAETLDQLATAVVIFDRDQRLTFHNQAFQNLWSLDAAFLAKRPSHTLLLDRLRTDGRLEEKPDWRSFKDEILSAYRAQDSHDDQWHLPDGRIVRVLSNPNPNGGLTQIFENLTQQISLESENKTLLQVRRETLDHLIEAVAVFATDGTLKLFNPAFSQMWGLGSLTLREGTHIKSIAAAAQPVKGVSPWQGFIAEVTGADDSRQAKTGRIEFPDNTVLAHTVSHLPNGQTMLTFVDVTDSVNAERNLKSKNQALEDAALVKNRFVHHMSYELRSPLTSIKGFAEILKLEKQGTLTERQVEYIGHILRSSNQLEMLINDVLDLATIDADMLQLVYGPIDVRETIEAAGALVGERLREHKLSLAIEVAEDAKHMEADAMRLRQILLNLIDNAANYAPEGSTITVQAEKKGEKIALSVRDHGPGIPNEDLQTILERFEHKLRGGRRRGAGIGLSIVSSFVRLHKGTVSIDSAADRGTLVTCLLPIKAAATRQNAAE
jgi:signal transduction histidine kinase